MGAEARAAGAFPAAHAVGLALFGLLARLGIWLAYRPVVYADTRTYLRLARDLQRGGLEAYDGTRVPGYPLIALALGGEHERMWLLNLALGWAFSLLLFWMAWRLTRSPGLALTLGMLYNLIPGQFLFESNLLTETPTAFAVALSLALLLAFNGAGAPRRRLGLAFALGVAASLAGLLRPLFFLLPAWLLPFVVLGGRAGQATGETPSRIGRRLLECGAFSLAPLALLGGWIAFIYGAYGMLAPTTMGGYHLVQHTGAFFELLPDEEATVRDIYLRYRDERIAERGNQANTIWEAIPELSRATGMSFFDLSREMQRLSLDLMRDHPQLYLRSAAEGWLLYWIAPPYWDPAAMRPEGLRALFELLTPIGRALSVACNLVFLALSAAWTFGRRARRRLRPHRHALAVAGLILVTSLAQTLVDHGDNARFLVPMQMLVFYAVAVALWNAWPRRPEVAGA